MPHDSDRAGGAGAISDDKGASQPPRQPRRPQGLAKLVRPRLYDIVERERLFQSLDNCRSRPLVWIGAPPGAGKTTLVASYVQARKLAGIWYQVDPGDGDPDAFFYYLREAVPPRRRVRLPLLTPEYLPDIQGFVRRFFRALWGLLPRPSVLVLDNFQEVAEGAPFRGMVHDAVSETPEGANLIAVSRNEPPAEFARLRASGSIAEIGWEELRLTREETEAIASLRGECREDAARELHERSEGWAAGLTLLMQQGGTSGAVPDGKIVVYSSTDSSSAEPLLQEFQKLYPFVKVEYNDLNTTEIYNRFVAEAAAGAGSADLLWSSAMSLQMKLVNDGYAQSYASPETPGIPKWAVWRDQAYGTTLEPVILIYYKRLVPADAVPKTHADIAKADQGTGGRVEADSVR